MVKQNYNNAIVDSIESETEDGSETDVESLMSDVCENRCLKAFPCILHVIHKYLLPVIFVLLCFLFEL